MEVLRGHLPETPRLLGRQEGGDAVKGVGHCAAGALPEAGEIHSGWVLVEGKPDADVDECRRVSSRGLCAGRVR
jgi:hypothetical protein